MSWYFYIEHDLQFNHTLEHTHFTLQSNPKQFLHSVNQLSQLLKNKNLGQWNTLRDTLFLVFWGEMKAIKYGENFVSL